MSTTTAPVSTAGLATLPRVDLLPPEIAQERRFARLRLGLAGVLVVAVGTVGGVYALQARQVSEAEATLAGEQARTASLAGTAAEYAEVPRVFGEVDAGRARLAGAMAQEVRWSYQLNSLSLHLPATVWVESLAVTAAAAPVAVDPATAPAGTAAVTPAPVYTLTVSGRAAQVADVAQWLDMVAARPGWSNPYFSSAQVQVEDGRKVVAFSSTVDIGGAALSHRFDVPGATVPTPLTTTAGT